MHIKILQNQDHNSNLSSLYVLYLKPNRVLNIKVQDEIFQNVWHGMKGFRGVRFTMLKCSLATNLTQNVFKNQLI